jgi:hypothetical protein
MKKIEIEETICFFVIFISWLLEIYGLFKIVEPFGKIGTIIFFIGNVLFLFSTLFAYAGLINFVYKIRREETLKLLKKVI